MQACPIASARATIGGPGFEPRTSSRNASFHERRCCRPAWSIRAGGRPRPSREALAAGGAHRRLRRRRGTAGETCRRLTAKRAEDRGLSLFRLTRHRALRSASSPFARPGGGRQWTPPSLPSFRVLTNVEVRAAGVYSEFRSRNVVVGRGTLRGRDALEDSGRRAGSVAADRQDALAAVGERDLEDGGAIDPRPVVDIVDEWWCRRGL